MFEKIVKNKDELNAVARHLREIHNFDELRHLAEEWIVPSKDVEDFITGKRYCLAEIETEEKEYATAEEKIREEMWILKDRDFADILSQHLINKSEEEIFSSQVLQPHKTLQKCLNYVMEQAYHIAEKKYEKEQETEVRGQNVGLALSQIQVYKWAEDYYALDDAEEEKKQKEEAKKAVREERKQQKHRKAAARERRTVGKNPKEIGNTEMQKKLGEAEKPKEAQLTLFDMMDDGTDKENKNESI